MPLCKIRAILGAMLSPGDSAEIDRMINHLRDGVRQFGNFRADLGTTALLVFVEHFGRAIMEGCPAADREEAAEKWTLALQRVAENIELYAAAISENSGQVH